MNAAVNKDYRTALYEPNITVPAIISGLLHIGVFLLAIYGVPYISKDLELQDVIIPVELFDPSEIIETNKIDEPEKSEEEDIAPPPERKPVYNNSDSVPDLIEPQEPEIEENVPEPAPKVAPPDPTIIKKPPKPKAKPKPPKRPEPVQEKPKEEDKKPDRDITSLLKSLTPDEPEENSSKNPDMGQGKTSQNGDVSKQMTSSDLAALVRGVQPCWNVNAGGRNAEDLVVRLRVLVNRDRSVRDVIVMDQMRYISDSHFKSAADAAKWALLNPRCSTLNLPPEKYDSWKSFIFVFDPSQML